jgi:hypothetical protein
MVKRKTSALEKIESHEKLCRIMQKQTFEQIKELKERICRIEKSYNWRFICYIFSFTF